MTKRTLTERQKARKARKTTRKVERATEWVKAHGVPTSPAVLAVMADGDRRLVPSK